MGSFVIINFVLFHFMIMSFLSGFNSFSERDVQNLIRPGTNTKKPVLAKVAQCLLPRTYNLFLIYSAWPSTCKINQNNKKQNNFQLRTQFKSRVRFYGNVEIDL